ncbi:MAG: hypothetical protein CL627_07875 [Aurantimonas sp.]|nr:hypothetical protein [Aurantimonas sp.]
MTGLAVSSSGGGESWDRVGGGLLRFVFSEKCAATIRYLYGVETMLLAAGVVNEPATDRLRFE